MLIMKNKGLVEFDQLFRADSGRAPRGPAAASSCAGETATRLMREITGLLHWNREALVALLRDRMDSNFTLSQPIDAVRRSVMFAVGGPVSSMLRPILTD